MGAWSHKPFGNDTAFDWLADLERTDDHCAFIDRTIGVIGPGWNGSAPDAEQAIAAIAVVAAACTEPIGPIHKEAKSWIATKGFVPDDRLVDRSKEALRAICDQSELRDLWEESGRLQSWLRATLALLESLEKAADEGLPQRKPKRRSTPRLLYKLIEHYRENPSERIRTKIRDKVASISDVHEATNDTNYEEPLALVSRYGLTEETRILLEKGADPNVGSPNPFTAACVSGSIECAEVLRAAGAQVFFEVDHTPGGIILHQMQVRGIRPKEIGYTYCLALFSVARSGTPPAAEYLVGLGADLYQTDLNDENLLHKASESGNIEMLECLLNSGLDVNRTKGDDAESPLHYAVNAKKIAAVEYLLNHGANPNIIDKFEGVEHRWYETPLDLADRNGDKEIVALLRQHGGRTAEELMRSEQD